MEVFWKHSLSCCCDMFSPKTIKSTAISESILSYHLLSCTEIQLAANDSAAWLQTAGCENKQREEEKVSSLQHLLILIFWMVSAAEIKTLMGEFRPSLCSALEVRWVQVVPSSSPGTQHNLRPNTTWDPTQLETHTTRDPTQPLTQHNIRTNTAPYLTRNPLQHKLLHNLRPNTKWNQTQPLT